MAVLVFVDFDRIVSRFVAVVAPVHSDSAVVQTAQKCPLADSDQRSWILAAVAVAVVEPVVQVVQRYHLAGSGRTSSVLAVVVAAVAEVD